MGFVPCSFLGCAFACRWRRLVELTLLDAILVCCSNFQLGGIKRPCGLMDKALVFGTKDCRFESCQGHFALLPAIMCYVCAAHRLAE